MSVAAHEIQGTQEWHDYRAGLGNASEAAAVMGEGRFFPATPYQLWQVKTGRAEVKETPAMTRGSRMEEPARTYLEDVTGLVFEPRVLQYGRILSASLDGLTLDGETVLEIKVPMKGRDSDTWRHVEDNGTPPPYYHWQVQQQLLCSGAKRAIFAVCEADGETITRAITCEVLPDPKAHRLLGEEWERFFGYLESDEAPPLMSRDVVEREDDDWQEAASRYRELKAAITDLQADLKAAEKRLKDLADGKSCKGAGVTVTRYWRQGSIDYKAVIPEGVDLEQHRKPGTWVHRIDAK